MFHCTDTRDRNCFLSTVGWRGLLSFSNSSYLYRRSVFWSIFCLLCFRYCIITYPHPQHSHVWMLQKDKQICFLNLTLFFSVCVCCWCPKWPKTFQLPVFHIYFFCFPLSWSHPAVLIQAKILLKAVQVLPASGVVHLVLWNVQFESTERLSEVNVFLNHWASYMLISSSMLIYTQLFWLI